jgi:hypothetical protein
MFAALSKPVDVAQESSQGFIPQSNMIRFVPTAELKTALERNQAESSPR